MSPEPYTDEEIFTVLTLAHGTPPRGIRSPYDTDPGLARQVQAVNVYYNDVTATLLQLRPQMSIADLVDLRYRFYQSHGVTLLDKMRRY